jgi:hypothetical protein
MSNEKLFIRRSEARARLGVSEEVFTKLIRCKSLKPVKLTPNGRAFFKAAEVDGLANRPAASGKLSTPTPTPKKSK